MSKSNLVIVNNRPAAIVLPAFELSENPNPVDQIAEREGLLLLPGENSVSSPYWEAIVSNPALKIWLACGYLENKGPGQAKSFAEGIDSLPAADALKRIGMTDNVELLGKWKDETKRKTVEKACKDRIADLVSSASGAVK